MTRREMAALLAAGAGAGWGQVTPAERARRTSMRATQTAMTAERRGRSYPEWFGELSEMRTDLRAIMDAAPVQFLPNDAVTRHQTLRAAGTPPMFNELYTGEYVTPKVPDAFAWTEGLLGPNAVRAVSRWLKKQGIDLLFVPVPKMSDVYMDRIVPRGVPADKIVSPHIRKVLFELLEDDVEVIDLLPELLRAREKSETPLYLPADSHWSPAAWSVAVRMVSERLGRYSWAQAARKAAPLFTATRAPLHFPMSLMPLLPDADKVAVEPFIHPEHDFISRMDGKPYGNFDSGPVLLIGDSFSGLIGAPLAHANNLPVSMKPVPGGTIHSVKELLRSPEAMAEAKVVVWVVNYAIFLLHDWTGLPEVVKREWTGRK